MDLTDLTVSAGQHCPSAFASHSHGRSLHPEWRLLPPGNVNPDIMVGICRRQSFHVALNIRTDLKCSFAEDAAPMTAATLAPAVSKDFPI